MCNGNDLIEERDEDYHFEDHMRASFENTEAFFDEQIEATIKLIQDLEDKFLEFGWEFDINDYL